MQDGVLVFVPDFDRQKWYVMADKVEKVDSFGQTVFWLDDQRVLWDYNFSLRDLDRVGQIGYSGETTDVEMEYYSPWKRLFVYTDDEVYSIWKDNGTDNEAILQYSIVRWVNGFFAKMR
ncbi:MAG: hypothetical protein HC932_05915 [Thermales bacterium]|nr:hypothetical protein [Thermales bacterium]